MLIRSKTDSGINIFAAGEAHRKSTGELIEVQKKRGRWFNYFFGEWDRKRALYCMKHRDDKLPAGFREGDLTLRTLIFGATVKDVL